MTLARHDAFARLKALQRLPAASAVMPARKTVLQITTHERHGNEPENVPCGDSVAQSLGGRVSRNQFGECLTISNWFAEHPEPELDAAVLSLLWPDAPQSAADPQQWLFLDTETTGLAGGTGTYAFLIGIAWWQAGGLQIEQFFMRDLNEEWPVLSAVGERLQQRAVLVTFNGKSFDWPLLDTRFRMTRTISAPQPRAHLDFLHPARNLWRLRLGSVRLSELERQVLGWHRGDDLVSDLIPQIYLEFLRGGPAEALVPILRHNQMDLRGLAALSGHVLSLFADPETCGQNPLDVYGASRIYERRGDFKRAQKLYEYSIASCLPADVDRSARTSLARLAKRDGDYVVAMAHWERALGSSREGLHAYERLSMYYEHNIHDTARALELTRSALAELRRARRLGTIAASTYRQWKTRFEHRLARLERKMDLTLRMPALLKSEDFS